MRAENQLPKNIRQIGGPVGTTKVYIEDFVVTFLKALTTDKNTFVRGAILFGEKKSIDNETVIFIRGAVEGQNIELDLDETVFDDKVWREIYQKKERFFPDLDVIGWALSRMGFSVRLNDKIKKTHFENFPGDGKVLYMTDHLEGEDAFYVYRGQDLVRQSGYYIYYEKNPMMQEYLIERNQKLKEVTSYENMLEAKRDEKIVRQFRTIVQEKQKSSKTRDRMKRLSSSAAMLLVLILAGGMFYYSRLDKSSSFGDAIHGAVETMGRGVKDNVSMDEENKESGTTTKQLPADTQETDDSQTTTAERDKKTSASTRTTQAAASASTASATQKSTQTAARSQTYVVRKGDSLVSISRKMYGTRKYMYKILDANRIGPKEHIYPGQKLIIPSITK
ncbi:LysM peptidoglycan-binding domain-containing protein [Anaerostipes sp.]|uniref:LysM peptidoglycan-binding domain-containing protein n=1 Tax=Anaerostipes sp. TaxID=1872530 RepID=UPI0025C03477|nr:LysM peptidoglycan-binding domain-containing protein [Anaerostipes sp.]MBS7009529.1 LysM peptidoglycan-binding domain-containing protein [Anaerostipes sp.]